MTTEELREQRTQIFRDLGATEEVAAELLAYADTGFDEAALAAARDYPLADEPFVEAWEHVAHAASRIGTVAALRQTLVQLRFAVEEGMSTRPAYQAAMRRGILPGVGTVEEARFSDPEGVSLVLHSTAAGRLPVIIAESRADFELLVRAVTRRNEPQPIPASMGACIVGGYNNWSRVASLRAAWASAHPALAGDDSAWSAEFARIVPQREVYQDRFIILSTGPYSDAPARAVGLSADTWRRHSLTIRLEHECAHYFTRRVLGSMRNALLDELIADYAGIVAARGRFEPGWLVHFMGVEDAGFRPGGRLENYRGSPSLSDGAFSLLQEIVRRAAISLAEFDHMMWRSAAPGSHARTLAEVAATITAIARLGLERLTQPDAAHALYREFLGVATGAPEYTFTS